MNDADILTGENPARAAVVYYRWGVNVTAIVEKRPAHTWKQYQADRQTPDEARGLPWAKATGVGAIHGIGAWRCFDLDKCEGFEPVACILGELGLPDTYPWTVRTGGGWHVWVRCGDELPPDLLTEGRESGVRIGQPGPGFDFHHLELRWEACQTLLPPSLHVSGRRYAWHNRPPEEPPAEVPIERVARAALAVCTPPPAAPHPDTLRPDAFPAGPSTEHVPDAERVRSALYAIPPRPDYDTWLRIVSAVLDGLDGDVRAAEALLASWSPEEEPSEYARKLRAPLERVTVGTLYHYAKSYGWSDPRKASASRGAGRPHGRPRGDAPGSDEHAAEDETGADGEDYIADGPRIPAAVYDALPDELRAPCLLLRDGHERDVFLTGLLPCLSAAMPNVLTRYSRRWKALPIMAAVVAPAGSGKGTLQLAADTVASIDERLRAASQARLDEWQALDKKERDGEARPEYRRLRLAADSSLRAITDGLLANEGRGLIFETEIRVLASSLKQDWGDFKGLLLKAAEQEPYERGRKGEPPTYLRRPELPCALSGTPRSFTDWMEDAEDGLFSRFLFYAFTSPPVWLNQFEEDEDDELDAALARIGRRLDGLHRALSDRTLTDAEGQAVPLYLVLTRDQREHVNRTFAALQQAVHGTGRAELLASVKRGAFQAVRIAGVLALYRLAAQGGGAALSSLKSYSPSDAEVRAAVVLVRCYLEHAARLAVSFASNPAAKLESDERRRFFEALPDAFETAEALAIGADMGMSARAVERALKTFTDRHGLVTRLRRGQYRKTTHDEPASPALPSPLTGVTEATEATVPTGEGMSDGQLPPLPTVPTEPSLPSNPARGDGDGLPHDIPPELLDAAPGWEDEDDAPLDYL